MEGKATSQVPVSFHSARPQRALAGLPAQAGPSPQRRALLRPHVRAASEESVGCPALEFRPREGEQPSCHAQVLPPPF